MSNKRTPPLPEGLEETLAALRALVKATPQPAAPPAALIPPQPAPLCGGFRLCAGGFFTIYFGHQKTPGGMRLLCGYTAGQHGSTVWRDFDVPLERAAEAAEELVCDAFEFIEELRLSAIRPNEDLGVDDFIEHVRLTAEGMLN